MKRDDVTIIDLGNRKKLELPRSDYLRLKALASREGLTPEKWLRREIGHHMRSGSSSRRGTSRKNLPLR